MNFMELTRVVLTAAKPFCFSESGSMASSSSSFSYDCDPAQGPCPSP